MADWDTEPRRKPWKAPRRNYANIRHEAIRREIDAPFNTIRDELSFAYYRKWRYGESHPVRGFDVQATRDATDALYQRLRRYIDDRYLVAFHAYNMSLPARDQVPQGEYDHDIRDEDTGEVVDTRLAVCTRRKAAEEQAGLSLALDDPVRIEGAFEERGGR